MLKSRHRTTRLGLDLSRVVRRMLAILVWGTVGTVIGLGGRIATAVPIDGFDTGADGWTSADLAAGAFGPAVFDASLGVYHFETTGVVPSESASVLAASWDASADPFYSNGFLGAKIRADTAGTDAVGLFMRSPGPELLQGSYGFRALSASGNFDIVRFDGPPGTSLASTNLGFAAGEDWNILAGAVGDELSLKAWQVGEPEPLAPQLTVTDSTYASGHFGVAAAVFPGTEAQLSATFDDISFVAAVPEPTSAVLAVVGTFTLFWVCRRPMVEKRP